jgi:hypothetical protein
MKNTINVCSSINFCLSPYNIYMYEGCCIRFSIFLAPQHHTTISPFVHCVRKNERQRKDSLILLHSIHFFHSDFYRSSIRFFSFLCGRTLSLSCPGIVASLVWMPWEWKGWNIKSCWREWNRMLFALRKQLHLFASTMRCIIEDRGFMYQR